MAANTNRNGATTASMAFRPVVPMNLAAGTTIKSAVGSSKGAEQPMGKPVRKPNASLRRGWAFALMIACLGLGWVLKPYMRANQTHKNIIEVAENTTTDRPAANLQSPSPARPAVELPAPAKQPENQTEIPTEIAPQTAAHDRPAPELSSPATLTVSDPAPRPEAAPVMIEASAPPAPIVRRQSPASAISEVICFAGCVNAHNALVYRSPIVALQPSSRNGGLELASYAPRPAPRVPTPNQRTGAHCFAGCYVEASRTYVSMSGKAHDAHPRDRTARADYHLTSITPPRRTAKTPRHLRHHR